MKRRLSFLLCLLVVSWALSLTVLAAAPALQDEAGLLQDPQGLEALLTQAGADYDTVVAACLVPSCDGQDPDLAAEEAYDRVYGPNTPGILLFIAQSERVYRITVTQGSREAFNDKALALCRRHPEYFRTAGSDTHQAGDEARAGLILPRRVQDSYAYKAIIESRDYHLWSPTFQSFVDADEEIRAEEAAN